MLPSLLVLWTSQYACLCCSLCIDARIEVACSFGVCSAQRCSWRRSLYTSIKLNSSTPSRHLQQLQRVQDELMNLADTQQQDTRDIQELKEDIRAIRVKLDSVLASGPGQHVSSRRKLPPQLSVRLLLFILKTYLFFCSLRSGVYTQILRISLTLRCRTFVCIY